MTIWPVRERIEESVLPSYHYRYWRTEMDLSASIEGLSPQGIVENIMSQRGLWIYTPGRRHTVSALSSTMAALDEILIEDEDDFFPAPFR